MTSIEPTVQESADGCESWDLPDGAVIQVGDTLAPDITKGAILHRMTRTGSPRLSVVT